MSRTLRTAFTTLTIALALTACGTNQNTTTETPATETPATETPATEPIADRPATEPIAAEPIAAEPIAAEPIADETSAPEAPTPAVAPTPTTPPVPEHRRCSIDQAPDGGNYQVTGIKADDKHGGLTARSSAGYGYSQIGLFFNNEVIGTFLDSPEWPSCLVTADNNVWWEIHSPILPAGGWVNARYLTIHFGDVTFPEVPVVPEEPDAHGDCVYLPDLTDTCILVYRMGGEIVGIEVSEDEYLEVQYACIYQGFEPACEVLTFEGQDILAPFTHLDDMELSDLCQTGNVTQQKVACAELEDRSTI